MSERAERTVLSTAVLFLAAGVLVGEGTLGLVRVWPEDPVVLSFAELALFSVLFTDGMKAGLRDLTAAWHLPGRVLLLGLPRMLLGTALLARWVAGLPWVASFLLVFGALVSPRFLAEIPARGDAFARLALYYEGGNVTGPSAAADP